MQDWIDKYPRVQALLRQAEGEEPLTTCRTRIHIYDGDRARDEYDAYLPPIFLDSISVGLQLSASAQDGTPFCEEHFARVCVYPCCDTRRPPPYNNEWSSDHEVEFWQTDMRGVALRPLASSSRSRRTKNNDPYFHCRGRGEKRRSLSTSIVGKNPLGFLYV